MIYKEFQEQISSLKFFLKNIDISLDNFNGIINQTQLEVEKQKNKYINSGTKFIESITNIKKENANANRKKSELNKDNTNRNKEGSANKENTTIRR